MTESDFLRQLGLTKAQGDGVRREIDLDLRNAYLQADGSALTTTLTTNPGFAMAETNAMVLQWNAAIVVGASLDLPIPRDYDQTADELRIRLLAQMGGATDTPLVNINAYRKRAGAALTANLGPITGKNPSPGKSPLTSGQAANRTLSNALQVVEFDFSNLGTQPGDIMFFQIVPAAHGTDAIRVYGGLAQFRSDVVYWNESDR